MGIASRTIGRAGAVCALCILTPLAALADGKGEIVYRQKVMSAIGGHLGAAVTILKNDGGSMDHLTVHARSILDLARVSRTAFPAGSGPAAGKTEALDRIWDDGEHALEFVLELERFEELSAAFVEAAGTGDRKTAFAALGALGKNACKSCHSTYRE